MSVNRRQLLRYGIRAGIGSFLVAACSRSSISSAAPRDALAPTPHVDDGDAGPPPPVAMAESCDVTADNIEGPFYKPGAPRRAVLAGDREPGERLVLSGTVRSASCAVIAGAVLDIWHANSRGDYDNDGFGFRGQLVTDAAGRWQVSTVVPGRYLNGRRYRPAHVHVKLRAKGHDELTTQLYFEGDPYLKGDAFVVESLVMPHARRGDRRVATFDFVVA